jgi:membrane-anchored mycosin MYCP
MAGAGLVTAGVPVEAKPPAGACMQATPGGPPIRQRPWADKALAPDRAWPFSTGKGVLVAVIDSGVDYDHPQLSKHGKVLDGFDFIRNKPRADFDCVSHGTAVASIIAADPAPGIGFHGVAPGATILPVRVTDNELGDDQAGTSVKPNAFAQAIRYAADQGAQIINLSVVMYADVPVVRAAVQYAESKDVLLVAAVGNAHQDNGSADPIPYPAAYPGVVGVGAITIDGSRLPASQVGNYVDLVAPGGGVLAATREHGHIFWDGTSFATPFVSGAAALVRAAWPGLSASGVARRLLATASPARGGEGSTAYGGGVVDPYRAVTDGFSSVRPAAAKPLVKPGEDVAALQRAASSRQLGASAGRLVLFAVLALVLVGVVAAIVPRGRRRNWTAARATLPPDDHSPR